MLTPEEARRIALDKIASLNYSATDDTLVILDEETIERPGCWIFFYTSRRFIETGNRLYMLAGNAPVFVSKKDGTTTTFRTGLSVEKMIDAYEGISRTWRLLLTDDIYSDREKLSQLKRILQLSIAEIGHYKRSKRNELAAGAHSKMMELQQALEEKKIITRVILSE